jgi:hypothetical protein
MEEIIQSQRMAESHVSTSKSWETSSTNTRGATTPIHIPRTYSSPMDPSALSILTKLPPDIRNMIYGFLFVQDAPVEIIPGYLGPISDRSRCTRLSLARGVVLLRTCRQIYHEAVGILYSRNRSARLSRDRYRRFSEDWFFETWSRTIVLQTHLVKSVTISLDALETRRVRWASPPSFEVLPLLRVVWLSGIPGAAFRLYKSERSSHVRHDVDHMTSSLHQIATMDSLKLRRFSLSKRMLNHITMSGSGRTGKIEYGSLYGDMPGNTFATSEDGRLVIQKYPRHRLKDFLLAIMISLPIHIYRRISYYAGGVTWIDMISD